MGRLVAVELGSEVGDRAEWLYIGLPKFGGLGPTCSFDSSSINTTSIQNINWTSVRWIVCTACSFDEMAPKAKKPPGGQKPEDEQDDPLQAVVFTDSYETRFAPFTLETPRVCILGFC
jgi:hypothetical protein